MRQVILFISMSLCSTGQWAVASTYHVAQCHSDASNENSGSPDRPWKTISKAADTLEPGDMVIVHAGVYREQVQPARSGAKSRPITFTAAENEDVIISGADLVTGWSFVDGGIWKKTEWRHRFRTHPDNDLHRLIGRCEQVIVDGQLLKHVASVADMQPGTFCAMPEEKTLYVRLTDDADPNDSVVEASVRTQCFGLGYDPDKMSIRMDHNRYCWNDRQHLALFGVPWRTKHKRYDDLARWQKDRGQDLHSVVVDSASIRSDRGAATQPSDRGAISDYRPNNTIVLACDEDNGSHLHVQHIHSTIEPQELFVKRGGTGSLTPQVTLTEGLNSVGDLRSMPTPCFVTRSVTATIVPGHSIELILPRSE